LPYAFEVHHKPEHDMEKPTPLFGGLFSCSNLLSLFEVVISKAIEQYVCINYDASAKIQNIIQ
jgi:hypothetical protein